MDAGGQEFWIEYVGKGCHGWLVQQCRFAKDGKTLLGKPAVAPEVESPWDFPSPGPLPRGEGDSAETNLAIL